MSDLLRCPSSKGPHVPSWVRCGLSRRGRLASHLIVLLAVIITGIFLATTAFFPVQAAARVRQYRHVGSWESLQARERLRHLRGARPALHRFAVERRKVVRFEKSSFWNHRPYQFSSPTEYHGMMYVGVDAGKLYAVETKPIAKRWSFRTEGGIHAAAAATEEIVFVGDIKGFAYGVERATGRERWRVELDDEILAEPLVSGEKVFFVTLSGRLYCLDAASGAERWHTDPMEKGWGFSVRRASAPVLFAGTILVGTADGLLVAFREGNGAIAWVRQLGDRSADVFDIDSKPLIVEEKLYVTTADHGLFQIDPHTGEVGWKLDVGGANDLHYNDGTLYVSGGGILSAVEAKTGTIRWQQDFEAAEISSPAVGEHFIATVSTRDKLYLVDRESGDIAFSRFVSHGSFGDPIVIGNEVVLLANTSRLFSFRVRELPPLVARKKLVKAPSI